MTKTVTVLGTGTMGAGMARNLLGAGLDVTVWNRSPDRARPLADAGARIATDAAEAVAGADVVVTMLFDLDAVTEVMEWALPAVAAGAVWAQTSTVGVPGTERLAELAAAHDVAFVDAPVLGTRGPAEQGSLVVVAGGPEAAREAVAPVFEAVGSRTVWVGEHPGDGQRLKLVVNSYVGMVMAGVGQAMALAEGLGLDPRLFLDAVGGGPLDSPYVQLKGAAILADEFAPAFSVSGARKDLELVAAAMRDAGLPGDLAEALATPFRTVQAAGRGDDDMAAVVDAFRRPTP